MDKGQHLRLVILGGSGQSIASNFVAFATDLTLHLSAQTEDSTTKDDGDTDGQVWNYYDVTGRSGDIQFGALTAIPPSGQQLDTTSMYFEDFIDMMDDATVDWKICFVSGTNNRTLGKTVCSGKGKVTNLVANAPNRQKATYNGTINIYGTVTVGSD